MWHGRVPREKLLTDLLPTMDVFIMPTREDMQPWALIEAASIALPIITTRMAGIPDVVVDGTTGLLTAWADWDAVRAAMQRLCEDATLRDTMGRAARQRIRTRFNPDEQFGGLLARLKSLARQNVAE